MAEHDEGVAPGSGELPFDGEYEQHLSMRGTHDPEAFEEGDNPLAWLSKEDGLKYAVDFYRLVPREQTLLGLTAAAMEVIVPLLQQMPDTNGLGPKELTALVLPRIAKDEWVALFRVYHKKVVREKLLPTNVVDKLVAKVRESALSQGNQAGMPWAVIVWASVVGSYTQALEALVKGNFRYYAHSCIEMVSIGLITMGQAMKEWEAAGRPLEAVGFTLDERMRRATVANAAHGGGAQAQAGDIIGDYKMPPPTGRKREE